MRLAVMPRTRERSEWSGHGVDGQTAPAKTAPQAAGAKTGSRTEGTEPHRRHGAEPERHRADEESHGGRYGTPPVRMGSAPRSRREGKAFPSPSLHVVFIIRIVCHLGNVVFESVHKAAAVDDNGIA